MIDTLTRSRESDRAGPCPAGTGSRRSRGCAGGRPAPGPGTGTSPCAGWLVRGRGRAEGQAVDCGVEDVAGNAAPSQTGGTTASARSAARAHAGRLTGGAARLSACALPGYAVARFARRVRPAESGRVGFAAPMVGARVIDRGLAIDGAGGRPGASCGPVTIRATTPPAATGGSAGQPCAETLGHLVCVGRRHNATIHSDHRGGAR